MTGNRGSVSINTSVAKQHFSFPKADRFYTPNKKQTNAFAYNLPSSFNTIGCGTIGKGFGSSQMRFSRNGHKRQVDVINGPGNYDRRGNSFATTAQKFSFGVGRH